MTLVEQIDACGHALLEIVDHLLDFAKLRNKCPSNSDPNSSIAAPMVNGSADSDQRHISDKEPQIVLDDVTEDVVESTVHAHFRKRSVKERARVTVVLDIDRSPEVDWTCTLSSESWKRICSNLIENALKYTDYGFVHVTMQQKQRSHRRFEAILRIADSGKGMSKAFIDEALFQIFAQEDTNAQGMGIGMNMVGQTVRAMGGSISVTSNQEGAGTCFTVAVPLVRNQTTPRRRSSARFIPDSAGGIIQSLPIGIVLGDRAGRVFTSDRVEQLENTASMLAISSVEKTCRYLGLEVQLDVRTDCPTTEINFMSEESFMQIISQARAGSDAGNSDLFGRVPSIVICKNISSAKPIEERLRQSPGHSESVVEYIASPCGRTTISRAIMSVLQRKRARGKSQCVLPHDGLHPREIEPLVGEAVDLSRGRPIAVSSPPSSPSRRDPTATSNEVGGVPASKQSATKTQGGEKSAHPRIMAIVPTARRPTLLLVDDNKINLQLLVGFARKHKYPYLTAIDGQLALNTYVEAHEGFTSAALMGESRCGRPSVILMDINMPVMDGYQATQRIRSYEKKHGLSASTIIALTALSSTAAHQEAFGSGCDLFLTKPMKLANLAAIIETGQRDNCLLNETPEGTPHAE